MDIATLGIKIDGNGAVQTVKQLGEASDKTSTAIDRLIAAQKQENAALRTAAEAWSSLNDWQQKSYANYLRQNGLMQRFLEIQRQVDAEMVEADKVAAAYAASQAKAAAATAQVDTATKSAHVGLGHLRGGVQSLVTVITGFNPVVSQAAGVLGSFAVGSAVTVGILAGIAAIGLAWDKLTENGRKLRGQTDKVIEGLIKQRELELGETIEGKTKTVKQALDALNEAKKQLAVAQSQGFSPIQDIAGGAPFGGGGPAAIENIEQKIKAVTQAQIEYNEAITRQRKEEYQSASESWDLEKSLAADRKRWADETREAADKAKRQRDQELADMEKRARIAGQHAEEERQLIKSLAKAYIDYQDELSKAAKARQDAFLSSNGLDDKTLHAQIALNVDEGLKQIEDAKKYAEDMKQIWRQGIGRIITDGTKSFRDFFEDVLQMFSRLMSRMEQEGKTGGFGYKALGVGSAAISGAFTGYQLGGVAGSANGGAVLGGVGGALTGFQIAGPIGAVVGGLTGLVGGLLGGAQAAREHARALREAARQLQQATLDFHARATGNPADALAAQIAAIKAEAERLKDDYLKVHGGDTATAANKAARDAYFAARDADAAALIAKAQADAAKATKENTDALNKLTNSLGLNIPPGFRYQSLIFQNSAARPWAPGLGGTTSIPFSPSGGLPSYPKIDLSGDLSVSVTLDGNVIGKGVLKRFKDKSQKQFGDSTRWSEIQEA